MERLSLDGYCSFKQIAAYYGISTVTLRERLKEIEWMFDKKKPGSDNKKTRKRIYSPAEIDLIKHWFSRRKVS